MPGDSPNSESDSAAEVTGKHRPVRVSAGAEYSTRPTGEVPPQTEMSSGPPAVPGYDVVGELGRGGSAVVLKAWDVAAKRFVALKMVAPGLEHDPATRQRFLEEAKSHARLEHPNIVAIHQLGVADEWPFFALEFCGGGSLARKLAGNPILPQPAAELMHKIAGAVAHAHEHKVVHRDLKPANVMLTAEGEPKIGDFGLSKRTDANAGKSTKVGFVVGTPHYLAPELLSSVAKPARYAADIYALGAILYECLTGRPPFKGATMIDTIDQIRHQRVIPPRMFERKIPPDLEAICLKCLEREPVRRYATAKQFADDLGRFLNGRPVNASRRNGWTDGLDWAKQHKLVSGLFLLAGLIFAASLVLAALYLTSK